MATKPLVSPEFSSIVSDLALKTLGAAVGNLPLGKMAGAVLSQRLRGTADLRRLEDKSRKAERYIVSAITTQQASAGPVVRESLRSIHDTLKSSIVQSENETGRKIMQLTPHEAALLKENYAGLVVERDVQFRLAAESPLIPQLELITVPASSRIVTIRLTDSGGTPIRNARVFLQPKPAKTGYRGKTNAKGLATLSVRKTDTSFHRVTVVPESGFWSKVLKNVTSSEIDVRVGPLTANGFDWGPQCCEALKREPHRGKGIRVAVIDTGVAKHAGLSMKSGHTSSSMNRRMTTGTMWTATGRIVPASSRRWRIKVSPGAMHPTPSSPPSGSSEARTAADGPHTSATPSTGRRKTSATSLA